MTLDEYKKVVQLGMRVYVMIQGVKKMGTAAKFIDETEPIVRFDNGEIARVTEKSAPYFNLERPN